MTNVARALAEAARRHPERIALRLDETAVPYAALDAASAGLAGLLLAHGRRPGERIGVRLPDGPYAAMAYYGILRAGGVVVPMGVWSEAPNDAMIAWRRDPLAPRPRADGAGPADILVVPGEFERRIGAAAPVAEPVAREDDDVAVVLRRPGTADAPDETTLTHADLRRDAERCVAMLDLRPDDVILGALPPRHDSDRSAGLDVAVAAGACLTLMPRFDPAKALAIIERDGVSVFEGPPPVFAAMLRRGVRADTGSLRLCLSVGPAMSAETRRRVEEAFGCAVLERDGLSRC